MSKNQKPQVEFQLIATKVSTDGEILTIVKRSEYLHTAYYQGMIDENTCKHENHFIICKSEILGLVIKDGYRLTPLGKNDIK